MGEPTGQALLICYGNGKPALSLVDPFTGRSKPFASPVDRAGIATDAAHRCGDGVVLDPHGDYYGIAADLSGPAFDLGRFGRGESAVTPSGVWRRAAKGEFELVSWRGERLATRSVPDGWAPVGEAATGLVAVDRGTRSDADDRAGEEEAVVLAADGGGETLPGVGEICAVADRHVVRIRRRAELSIVDVLTGGVIEVEQPDIVEFWWPLDVCFDPTQRYVALAGYTARTAGEAARFRRPTVVALIDVVTGRLAIGDRIDGPQHPVWSADGAHLFVGDVYNDRLHIVDPQTLTYAASPAGSVGSSPKVDVGDLAPPLAAAPSRVWLFGESTDAIPRTLDAAVADLSDRLSKIDDEAFRQDLRRAARPSIRFVRSDFRKRTGTGHTRVGGRPDLPKGARWPTTDGAPLAFIGQVDLAAASRLRPSPLPQQGTLLFFFGPYLDVDYTAAGRSQVIYVPADQPTSRRPWPKDLPAEARFAPVYLEPAIEMTVPNHSDAWPESQCDSLERVTTTRIAGPVHRMLGDPDLIQGYEIGELVIQFDSDAEAGFIWGDSGMLYFTVEALEALDLDFESVEAHVESG